MAHRSQEVTWPYEHAIHARGILRALDYGNVTIISRRSRIRLPFLIIALTGLAFVSAGGITAIIIGGIGWEPVLMTAVPIVVIYLSVVRPYIHSWTTLRRLRKAGFESATWTFNKDGIRVVDTQSDTNLKWGFPRKAIVTRRYVLLYLGDRFHTFAAPMFSSFVDWRHFRLAIIRNFIGCRACGYDLHGTTSDTCPECGKPID